MILFVIIPFSDCLSENELYKSKLDSYTPSPPKVEPERSIRFQNNDAVGNLITLCLQRKFTLPTFETVSISGESHNREFKISCRIGNDQTLGGGSTKKEAKQIAASEMLKMIDELFHHRGSSSDSGSGGGSIGDEVELAFPLVELPSVEESLAEYRRLRKSDTPPIPSNIRVRQNFFMKLSRECRMKAAQILMHHDQGSINAKDTVDDVFSQLNIRYGVMPLAASNVVVFHLIDSVYDCVIMGRAQDLYTRVVDYMKVMLNYQKELVSSSSENSLSV